jgi:GT2 family glycosyltransferase
MPLSIIIVNYKSARLILDCLEHLYRDPVAASYEVIVVDNASGDDSKQLITSAFPGIIWLPVTYNSGFARANNEGIRRSTGDAVLLLNGDTLPDAAAVESCYRRLLQSTYVAAGVQLLNIDGSAQISGMYVMKGGLNYLLPLPYLGGLLKALGEIAKVKKPHVPDAGVSAVSVDVDWINGAFLMVKRSAIEAAGLLDEDFFLYAEEAEWCSRLKKQGRLCIYGDLNVIHLQGETANQEFGSAGKGYYNLYDRKGLQIMLSNFVRIRKQFGAGWFLVQLFFYITEIPIFLAGIFFSGIFQKKPRYRFSQFRRYCENIGVILRLSPAILKNKPYFYKVL